jgi:hypothetical protein
MMTDIPNMNSRFSKFIISVVLLLAVLLTTSLVSGHGGKKHAEEFTALQAVKKGITMYDRLVAKGKLKENWETDLDSIEVYTRASGKQKEFVVKFNRGKDEKKSCYIFFSEKGEYKGSNFTGD